MKKIEIITKSEQETRKVGEMLAKELKGKEVICLEGDLGGGKTTFVQGLARGLGIKQWPTSPTFVLVREYNNLYHIDCYRIKAKDLLKLGFKKILKSDKIKAIEWADKIKKILPKNKINIKFEFIDEKTRRIKIFPKAFEMAFIDNNDLCWRQGTSLSEDANLNNILDDYLALPADQNLICVFAYGGE